jgi:predicted amidohydrolase YtcJ
MIPFVLLLSAAAVTQAPADLIIRDAHIVTVDRRFSIVRAAAIRDGRFLAVGSDAEVMRAAGPGTRIVDLHGKTVLPGFNDTHVHLTAGEELPVQVDLTHIRSIKDIQAAIAARAKQLKPGEWIVGTRGWWEYQLAEGRLPARADLDAAAPENPVAIPGPHYMIVSSRALELADVTRDTPNPQGGEIYKDAMGEPTGLLMDNAGRAVRKFLPHPTEPQKEAGLKRILALASSHGLTSASTWSSGSAGSML